MGQAKLRGTKEERVARAVEKQDKVRRNHANNSNEFIDRNTRKAIHMVDLYYSMFFNRYFGGLY